MEGPECGWRGCESEIRNASEALSIDLHQAKETREEGDQCVDLSESTARDKESKGCFSHLTVGTGPSHGYLYGRWYRPLGESVGRGERSPSPAQA
jgi:hypothetical protein